MIHFFIQIFEIFSYRFYSDVCSTVLRFIKISAKPLFFTFKQNSAYQRPLSIIQRFFFKFKKNTSLILKILTKKTSQGSFLISSVLSKLHMLCEKFQNI